MMKRWTLLAAILASICFIGSSQARAQSPIDLNEAERMLDLNVVELEDQLVKGLDSLRHSRKNMFMRSSWVEESADSAIDGQRLLCLVTRTQPQVSVSLFPAALRAIGKQRGITVP